MPYSCMNCMYQGCSSCHAPGARIPSRPQWTSAEQQVVACAAKADPQAASAVLAARGVANPKATPPASNVAAANAFLRGEGGGGATSFQAHYFGPSGDFHGFTVKSEVEKIDGYRWPGVVVATFYTLGGKPRIVVECAVPDVKGALHIYNPSRLQARKPKKAPTNVSEPDRSNGNFLVRFLDWFCRKR